MDERRTIIIKCDSTIVKDVMKMLQGRLDQGWNDIMSVTLEQSRQEIINSQLIGEDGQYELF